MREDGPVTKMARSQKSVLTARCRLSSVRQRQAKRADFRVRATATNNQWEKSVRVVLLTIALLLSQLNQASAENYPSQRITVIAPFAPGSGTDSVARIVFQRLSELLKTTIVIDNRVGANGALGATA